ncbi:MAG: HPP family protein [Gammaproteobacteria bacterium]
MQLTRTLHPPGGAKVLIAVIGPQSVHDLGWGYLVPVMAGVAICLWRRSSFTISTKGAVIRMTGDRFNDMAPASQYAKGSSASGREQCTGADFPRDLL